MYGNQCPPMTLWSLRLRYGTTGLHRPFLRPLIVPRYHIQLRAHPVREHATTRAAADVHAIRVDVALGHRRVDRRHQVAVVGTWIVVIDRVAKCRPVASGSTGVGVEDDETVRGEILIDRVEADVV